MRRVFLIVLDSCGAGAMPDAAMYADVGVNTLRSVQASGALQIENLLKAGLGNITGLEFLEKTGTPAAAYGRLAEQSAGKDTTIGHWELAGVVSHRPLPTYPNGFPQEVLAPFCRATGRGVLANAPWSGTEVIKHFGDRHVQTGDLIVYTSADSVFQIAAHEQVVPVGQLYRYCRIAREILQGEHGVGRVIARPFTGTSGAYVRTANRHDFSIAPPKATLLDALSTAGLDVIGVGKIYDIFAGRGLTEHVFTTCNADGMQKLTEYADRDFNGLCFANLVDFDMLYGHRRDAVGYARALSQFDQFLPGFLARLKQEDIVVITADHGCDPAYKNSTDHTREYVPVLIMGGGVRADDLGTRGSFADIAATIAEIFGVQLDTPGQSFAKEILEVQS